MLAREVTAKLTMTHVQQFAQELGATMNATEVSEFLNHNWTAQNLSKSPLLTSRFPLGD
jgi:hypothetical protein